MRSMIAIIGIILSSILLAGIFMAPTLLMADRWQGTNNPARFQGKVKPKQQATAKKKGKADGTMPKTREHILLRGKTAQGSGRGQTPSVNTAKKKASKAGKPASHQLGPDNIQRKHIQTR